MWIVVECLPAMSRILGSIPSTEKKSLGLEVEVGSPRKVGVQVFSAPEVESQNDNMKYKAPVDCQQKLPPPLCLPMEYMP